jgi:PAT family beta-lactamase induction signal transducer AmpG
MQFDFGAADSPFVSRLRGHAHHLTSMKTEISPQTSPPRFPWIYVPTLYFAQGLPYVVVNVVSVVMYKKLGVPNTLIGLTSLLYLPWVVKPLWGPTVDILWTKRKWILASQALLVALFAIVGAILHLPEFFTISLVILVILAFTSATHDIAIDGFYMLALDEDQQAFYVGIRSTFYRLAMIAGSGALVVWAGYWETRLADIPTSWMIVMLTSAAVFVALFLFHAFYLPRPARDTHSAGLQSSGLSPAQRTLGASFLAAFKSYFQQPHIAPILTFIVLYRLGEAMLVKMAAPFLLDSRAAGGLALSTQTVGFVYGTVGVISLVIGGIAGGWLVAKFGLRKCIWPMAIALNAPDLAYVYLSFHEPALPLVYGLVALEQFGYGIGFSAFMVFLMYTAREPFKTSHYALSTGFMALGMMMPGLISGYLQSALGYQQFFIVVCLLTLPGMAAIFFIPLDDQ